VSDRLPDFLVIGAMKAGTTTLCSDLGAQPGVFMSPVKEPNDLLDESVLTEKGRRRYSRLFQNAQPDQLCGEGSTSYAKLPAYCGVAERARDVLGDQLRIIYSVRNPVERLISHYLHLVARLGVSQDIDKVIRSDWGLLEFSRYDMQLEPWLQNFGFDSIHVLRFEDFIHQRSATIVRVCEFLGCETNVELVDENRKHNAGNEQTAYPALAERFISSQFYLRTLGPMLTPSMKARFRRLLGRKPREQPALPSQSTLDHMIAELQPSVERLSGILGLKEPLWDLEGTRRKYLELIQKSKAVS
jgi:hypothetical protein